MEKSLELIMDEVLSKPGVFGVVFADHQGLCLGAKGKASTESSGIITAMAEQAGKLDKNKGVPTICIENDTQSCIIQRNGTITAAIYKTLDS